MVYTIQHVCCGFTRIDVVVRLPTRAYSGSDADYHEVINGVMN